MNDESSRADVINVAALVVLWIAMMAVVGPVADFPLNDDWIYAGSARSILENGHFWIPGPAIPNLFAQAWWGALFCLPFGFSFTALRFSTAVLGLTGVLTLYAISRRIGGAPRLALLGAAVLAVNPVYFNLSNTFMTDVPFLCVTLLALLCLVSGLQHASRWTTLLGLALALVAILIRQTGLFLLVGFAIAWPIRHGFRPLTLLRGGLPLVAGAAIHFAFHRWVMSTGRAPEVMLSEAHALIPASVGGFAVASLRTTAETLPYLGAFSFPFLILTGPGVRSRMTRAVLTFLGVSFLAFVVWKHDTIPVLKNLMTIAGIGPLTLRDVLRLHINEPVPTPLMSALWLAATAIGVAGVVLLADRVVRGALVAWTSFRAGTNGHAAWLWPLTVGAASAYWVGILMLVYWDNQLFDRYIMYLLPFVIVAAMVPARADIPPHPVRVAAAIGCIVVYAAFGVVGTHDYIAWNRARWRALDSLVTAQGIAPNRIDGGYEVNGWLQHDRRYEPRMEEAYWWGDDSRDYVIAFGPIDGYREIGRQPVARWLPSTSEALLVLSRVR
jgi:4-amino-4-deoxy-L-arabinose transferase-like glycosyltransferase